MSPVETSPEVAIAPTKTGFGPGEAPSWDYYSKCIHCGLCLNSCPTYRELGVEMDSPRGRIYQMIQVERGRLPLGESFVRHIDLCLDCRACETACPSGVEYGRLVESARGQIERNYRRPWVETNLRKLLLNALSNRERLEFAGKMFRFYQRSGLEAVGRAFVRPFSKKLARVARLAPRMEKPFFTERLGTVVPAIGERCYRVGFLAGCIANLAFARLNDATVRVLALNGCEVVIPRDQGCCGALHVHAGMRDVARELARQNIETFLAQPFDAVITNAAGCGSVLKEYPQLFYEEQTEWRDRAGTFSGRIKDVTEFLAEIDFNKQLGIIKSRATYQDPCHLGHAQQIRSAPRKLLKAIPGLDFTELKESEICCGSAGIYNVAHNDMAERLLAAKMQRIDEAGADLIVTANPGCLLQLRAGVAGSAKPQRRVMHVIELLDESYSIGAGH
ncbi:MAG: (Fe-S)-binding protein [Deltaproteobacteria bacterium]